MADLTRSEWATGFLTYAGWSVSQEKVIALVAQASKENTQAAANPLATTEAAPTATDFNSAGVKNYASTDAGYGATLATFTNGHYPELVAQLTAETGGSALAYAASPDLTVWGTGNCVAYVEEIKAGDPQGYMSAPVAGTATAGPDPSPPEPTPSPDPAPVPTPGGPYVQHNVEVEIKSGWGWVALPVAAASVVSVFVQTQNPEATGNYTPEVPRFVGVAAAPGPTNSPNGAAQFNGTTDGTFGVTIVATE